jgi:zinc protease
MVTVHQWFKVGSRDEKPGRRGMAHFFEHMMFKGTKKISEKQLKQTIEGNGGSFNAYTSKDVTVYHSMMPKEFLEQVLELESDRMRNLIISKPVVDTEREVVKEERRRSRENSVSGTISDAMFKTTFKVHPYSWSTIGYMKDLNSTSIADFQAFYDQYYVPNNATLIIAGDFDKSKAKSLVKKYYGGIKTVPLPQLTINSEPEQKSPRSVKIKRNVQNVTFRMTFRTPSVKEEDSYALDILSGILGDGASSRLSHRLVYKDQQLSSVYATNYTLKDAGIFIVAGDIKPGQPAESVYNKIYSELYKLRNQKVTEQELDKVRNQTQYMIINQLKTLSGKARMIGMAEVEYGDYRALFDFVNRYNKVTVEDIQRVANKYLTPARRSLIQVIPR